MKSWDASRFVTLRRLDFNDFGPLFRKQHACERAGNALR
jgi:hypothetical protein